MKLQKFYPLYLSLFIISFFLFSGCNSPLAPYSASKNSDEVFNPPKISQKALSQNQKVKSMKMVLLYQESVRQLINLIEKNGNIHYSSDQKIKTLYNNHLNQCLRKKTNSKVSISNLTEYGLFINPINYQISDYSDDLFDCPITFSQETSKPFRVNHGYLSLVKSRLSVNFKILDFELMSTQVFTQFNIIGSIENRSLDNKKGISNSSISENYKISATTKKDGDVDIFYLINQTSTDEYGIKIAKQSSREFFITSDVDTHFKWVTTFNPVTQKEETQFYINDLLIALPDDWDPNEPIPDTWMSESKLTSLAKNELANDLTLDQEQELKDDSNLVQDENLDYQE